MSCEKRPGQKRGKAPVFAGVSLYGGAALGFQPPEWRDDGRRDQGSYERHGHGVGSGAAQTYKDRR